mgnify:CR=1 FL=1
MINRILEKIIDVKSLDLVSILGVADCNLKLIQSQIPISIIARGHKIKLIGNNFFGEGLTILNDTIYQLTWKNNLGIVYKNNFQIIRTFDYNRSKEGWGLCNDGEFLYKSDGSSKIWKIDRKNFNEISYVEVTTDKTILKKINELEWANGKIYANTYQFNKDVVLIIDPLSGQVEGVIDFSCLLYTSPSPRDRTRSRMPSSA